MTATKTKKKPAKLTKGGQEGNTNAVKLIDQGVSNKLIRFDKEGKFITYIHEKIKRAWSNPEENIQAETFCKLVIDYKYSVKRIKQYVVVPIGSSKREADIIIYNDDQCKQPYIIIECKKQDTTDKEFDDATEQVLSYANAMSKNVKIIWITTGLKNYYLEFNKEQESSVDLSDIPRYGDEIPYKFPGGQPGNDNASKWTQNQADQLGKDLLEWIKKPSNVFYKKFLIERDIYKDVTRYLADKYQSFSAIIKRCKEIQEQKLIDGAMAGKHAQSMSIFMLKNKHGYADKQEIDQTTTGTITVKRTVVSRMKGKDQDNGSPLKKVS